MKCPVPSSAHRRPAPHLPQPACSHRTPSLMRSGAWLVSNSTQEEPTEPLNSSENEEDIKEEIETQTYPLFALVAALSVGMLLLFMAFLGWTIRKQS